ncbi:MAG: glycosyltransferase family 2 protein [Candidatus Doudnabacteria bacterium]|nr:glycosyltransferase family 2 protein [Candidatus Doudnabacteria bacterium]
MVQGRTKLFRALEIIPGVATWTTLLGSILLSYFVPVWVAIFILLFDLYWVLKAINTALHLLSSFFKLKIHNRYDWMWRLRQLADLGSYRQDLRQAPSRDLRQEYKRLARIDFSGRMLDWKQIYHLVILPTFKENLVVLDQSIRSIAEADFPTEKIFFILAVEERDYERAMANARMLKNRYGETFFRFAVSVHPDGIPGEIQAKGANLTYAARSAARQIRDLGISIDKVIVSALDSDTVVSQNYFAYLTYAFLTAEKPYRSSFQPMPVYNNNIWDAPAIARVVAVANSFWQMVEASRPDRLVTFSSHAMSLRALLEVDFWPVDVVSDDSQIFWRCWLHYDGDYRTVPIFTHISLDAMLDESYWKTLVGQYKQKRRWAWGNSENLPYLFTNALKKKNIPWWKRALYLERMFEGYYFWATASIMIAGLGWLPLLLGGSSFDEQILAVNLPLLTRLIMQIATAFLIFSVYINMVLIPKRPPGYSRWKTVNMVLQWFLVPIVSSIFGSLPAIDAQTRAMFGKYLGFWVTPKARRLAFKEVQTVFENHASKS